MYNVQLMFNNLDFTSDIITVIKLLTVIKN